jgi:NitT/TauT family transport system ATP-binding protein
MSQLVLDHVSVSYAPKPDETLLACSDISLTIEPGEFVTIIGPSGCGKSTLLHCMGGMLNPTEGDITFGGKAVVTPNPRDAAFIFQDYSLFPWKSVLENAGMGLKFAGGGSRQTIANEARRQLDFVGLAQFADRYPRELSGGMQQRVAIARALALEPKILLMDEPFGALDEQSRRSLGSEMARILADAGQTVVLITHSLDEAVFWADRILVMSPRPGTIAEEIRVETPRPRGLDFMTTKEFQDIRVHLFEQIQLH